MISSPSELTAPGHPWRRILLAVDGSHYAREVLSLGVLAAREANADVTVLHVREWLLGPAGPLDQGETEASGVVETACAFLRDLGVRATGELRGAYFGHVPREIVDAGRELNADLVIMGRAGVSGLMDGLLGSVTEKVLHLSDAPVLVSRRLTPRDKA